MATVIEEYMKQYPHANEGQIMQMMEDDGKKATAKSNALIDAQKKREAQERNEAHKKLVYLTSGSPKGLVGKIDLKREPDVSKGAFEPRTLLEEIHEFGAYTGFVYEDFYHDVIIFCGVRAYLELQISGLFKNSTMTNTIAPYSFEVRKI